jgi:hypothetical protein
VIDRNAVLVGVVLQIALLVTCGGTGTAFFRALPWFGALLLTSLGFFGGVAGGLVGGSRRRRAMHGGLCSAIGGFVFATWLYYTLVADVYLGAFHGLAYAIATIGIPPAFAAQYNTLLPVAIGVGAVSCYVLEGALAGALVPPEWIEPPPFYPS